MKIASSFVVPAAADKVLTHFLDASTMKACVPGCEELTQTDETHYQGSLVNEVAHVKFKARFNAEITSTSASQDTSEPAIVTAILRGEDRRLGSTIKINATLTITPLEPQTNGENSEVAYEFELAIWGKLGRLGESVIRRRTVEVEKQFAEALTAICSGQPIPQRPEKKSPLRLLTDPSSAITGAAADTVPTPQQPKEIHQPDQPARTGNDWLVLGLAVAAAFAYGLLIGERRSTRR